MDVIRQMITQKLESASGGIMRSFMARPCDTYSTRKVCRFLETTCRVFQTPDKIQEAIAFVQQFAFADIAQDIIARMMQYLRDDSAA